MLLWMMFFRGSTHNGKKATWQKLLLADLIKDEYPRIENACYLDTDIIINPTAPDIFSLFGEKTYGLVSQINNLPMPLDLVMRQYVFLRNKFYDHNYPLDSVVFMPLKKQYEYSGLSAVNDSACAGLIMFNVKKASKQMKAWFFKYDKHTSSITDGDQTHINWEIINSDEVQWLPYEFQALWVYEMAWKYPFLYSNNSADKFLVQKCIEASLFSNHFLHFAGSWHESDMWLIEGILQDEAVLKLNSDFKKYLSTELTGEPRGMVKPKKDFKLDE